MRLTASRVMRRMLKSSQAKAFYTWLVSGRVSEWDWLGAGLHMAGNRDSGAAGEGSGARLRVLTCMPPGAPARCARWAAAPLPTPGTLYGKNTPNNPPDTR